MKKDEQTNARKNPHNNMSQVNVDKKYLHLISLFIYFVLVNCNICLLGM